ncbi:MAG: SDR family NAD(P)-dependent oxidoreductase [Solirubrobacterales bacterium]|nr:SDR family NAD(P)-dependent oxidoreductase [Solirubrobacterales bacterium]HRV59234.1 SDR family NAD(P)-dependent oxidoreductase [Solirubrobacterales bacterium]
MEHVLEGAVVVVTGGAAGIGRATSTKMAEAGARVAIGDIHGEKAAEAAEEVSKRADGAGSGGGAIGKPLDVTDREGFELFLDDVEAELGPIDCLVNNAGVMLLGPIDEEEQSATRSMIDVNLVGVINGTQAAMKRMKQRGRGRIVNIASQAGKAGMAGGATYCATKFGVIGFSEAVRAELKGTGVSISWVLPGIVNTELAVGLPDIPLMDVLSPDDIAGAVLEALTEGGSEIWVPARNQWLDAPVRLLPRSLREKIFALTGADKVLAEADSGTREEYENRHSGVS